jgi:hypothetical protein
LNEPYLITKATVSGGKIKIESWTCLKVLSILFSLPHSTIHRIHRERVQFSMQITLNMSIEKYKEEENLGNIHF